MVNGNMPLKTSAIAGRHSIHHIDPKEWGGTPA